MEVAARRGLLPATKGWKNSGGVRILAWHFDLQCWFLFLFLFSFSSPSRRGVVIWSHGDDSSVMRWEGGNVNSNLDPVVKRH